MSCKQKLAYAILTTCAFYGIPKLAFWLLPKWIDILVGFPLMIYVVYRVALSYLEKQEKND